jgi:hypothetical protein
MGRNMTKAIAVLATALMVLSQGAYAAGNSGKRAIKNLVHANTERVQVVADSSDWKNPDACDRSDQIVLASNQLKSAGVYREMLAMILSAHVSDRQIAAKINGCVTINGKTFPKITQVTLY